MRFFSILVISVLVLLFLDVVVSRVPPHERDLDTKMPPHLRQRRGRADHVTAEPTTMPAAFAPDSDVDGADAEDHKFGSPESRRVPGRRAPSPARGNKQPNTVDPLDDTDSTSPKSPPTSGRRGDRKRFGAHNEGVPTMDGAEPAARTGRPERPQRPDRPNRPSMPDAVRQQRFKHQKSQQQQQQDETTEDNKASL